MFAKLLKHEWKATWRYIGILCLGAVVASVMGGGAMRYLVKLSEQAEELDGTVLEVVSVFLLVGAFLAIAVCAVGGFAMLMVRFYRGRFTDEGYLTFTLPVSTHEILLSSLVNTLLNLLLLTVVVLASGLILLLIGISAEQIAWEELRQALPQIREALAKVFTVPVLKIMGTMAAAGIAGTVWEVICLMLAITLGALAAKKHKILAAVGFFYGIQMAVGIVQTGTMLSAVVESGESAFFAAMLRPTVMHLVLAVAGYFLMWYLTDRKLNLS